MIPHKKPMAVITESLQIIRDFLSSFPPEESRRCTWELLTYALGSEEADNLTHIQRGDLLYFYEQVNKVCEALVVIDKNCQLLIE